MADSSFTQSNFLGGRFSPAASGRIDLPEYKKALAECLNMIPQEDGSLSRRSGTRDLGLTAGGNQAVIFTFWLPKNYGAILEFSQHNLQIWLPDFTTGTYRVQQAYTNIAVPITVNDLTTMRIIQSDNQAFIMSPGNQTQVLTCTNYDSVSFLGTNPTWVLDGGAWQQADGPYLDPATGASQTNNAILKVTSGNYYGRTFTVHVTDGAYSFIASDLNRNIRMWFQPLAFDTTGGTTYNKGDTVSYAGLYWTQVVGGSLGQGVIPGNLTQPAANSGIAPIPAWSVNPYLAGWAWGYISQVVDPTHAVVILTSPQTLPVNQGSYQTGQIDTYQLGLYTANTWPRFGCYHEGRVWLGGAVNNRIDACVADSIGNNGDNMILGNGTPGPPLFSPTDQYGNVLDSSGIAAIYNLSPASRGYWAIPDHAGIIIGTSSGECLINATVLGDPITPFSFQIHHTTSYKCANIEPVRMGIATGFIQAFKRSLYEYVVDVFSQKFIGRHLNIFAKDLTVPGIERIVYQEELAPVIWGITNDNQLLGCTYRRISSFGSEAPVFYAWHQHVLGSGRFPQWMTIGSSARGQEDVLVLVTFKEEPGRNVYHLEMLQPQMDQNDFLGFAWFCDSALAGAQLKGDDNSGILTIFPADAVATDVGAGVSPGSMASVWIAGVWAGDYEVLPQGEVLVPYGKDPDGILNAGFLQTVGAPGQWGTLTTAQLNNIMTTLTIGGVTIQVPCVIGSPIQWEATLLRPQDINDIRTTTGPGLGKTRRLHMYGLQVANTITDAINIEVDNGPSVPVKFYQPDGQTEMDHQTLYNGVAWDTVDDDYGFDGQITLAGQAPYPVTIAAVQGFVHTQDR